MPETLPERIKRLQENGSQKVLMDVQEVADLLKAQQEKDRQAVELGQAINALGLARYWLCGQFPKQAFDVLNGAVVHFQGAEKSLQNPFPSEGTP